MRYDGVMALLGSRWISLRLHRIVRLRKASGVRFSVQQQRRICKASVARRIGDMNQRQQSELGLQKHIHVSNQCQAQLFQKP